MDINNYSIASHLIHSRLEMIRERFEFEKGIFSGTLVFQYREYFDKASEAILIHHNVQSENRDLCGAARLNYYMILFYPKPSVKYYAVEYRLDNPERWVKIKSWNKNTGHDEAFTHERLTLEEARSRLESFGVKGMVNFRIKEKFRFVGPDLSIFSHIIKNKTEDDGSGTEIK